MKHLRSAVTLGVSMGALLFGSVAGQAQTPTNLSLSASNTSLNPGDILDLSGIATPGTAGGTVSAMSGLTGTIVYDPTVFATPTFTINGSSSFNIALKNQPVNFTLGSTTYQAYDYSGSAFPPSATTPVTFGTYHLQVLPGASGSSEIYYTSVHFTQAQMTSASTTTPGFSDGTQMFSKITSVNSNVPATTFNNGSLTVTVGGVPGPSSLAVFAMGAVAPVMTLLRRRRHAAR